MTTKKARILALWDGGARDKQAIAEAVGSTPCAVRTVLSNTGRTRDNPAMNGPTPVKTPRILAMWDAGERDIGRIAAAVDSSPASVRGMIHKARMRGRSRDADAVLCAVPPRLVEEAWRRGEDPTRWAERILHVVATDDMYDAVLDE